MKPGEREQLACSLAIVDRAAGHRVDPMLGCSRELLERIIDGEVDPTDPELDFRIQQFIAHPQTRSLPSGGTLTPAAPEHAGLVTSTTVRAAPLAGWHGGGFLERGSGVTFGGSCIR